MRITTIKKVYWYDTNNENRDIGFVIIWDNDRKYLEITVEFKNEFYIGKESPSASGGSRLNFGTGFVIRLGFLVRS
jgi:hypothetical protein